MRIRRAQVIELVKGAADAGEIEMDELQPKVYEAVTGMPKPKPAP